jgi:hypothetical protein
MREPAFNPAMIRVVVIVLFVIISQFLRARKRSQSPKPTLSAGTAKASPLDEMREAMRQAADQARARRGQSPVDTEPQLSQELQQPPTIEPESSFIPSLLLMALFACLCFMAYRYWAG